MVKIVKTTRKPDLPPVQQTSEVPVSTVIPPRARGPTPACSLMDDALPRRYSRNTTTIKADGSRVIVEEDWYYL